MRCLRTSVHEKIHAEVNKFEKRVGKHFRSSNCHSVLFPGVTKPSTRTISPSAVQFASEHFAYAPLSMFITESITTRKTSSATFAKRSATLILGMGQIKVLFPSRLLVNRLIFGFIRGGKIRASLRMSPVSRPALKMEFSQFRNKNSVWRISE